MYKKILIPLDNSSTDNAILEHVRPLIRMTGAKIILVHVADGFGARLQDDLNLADSEEMTQDRAYLEKVRQSFIAEGFLATALFVQGKDPGESILALAEKEQCDLIAMATHGHGFVKDMILGSVADHLRHNTSIPILMIRAAK
jgi:nucleotide-binding universal stress UspA family protein